MPLPFDFEGKGVLVSSYFSGKSCFLRSDSFGEPTSVLDSTLSSSLGGGGSAASTDTAGVADRNPSPKWQQESTTATSSSGGGADSELAPVPPSLGGGNTEKCALEDWENVLSESAPEQSIFRWIMGDVEDPAMGSLNKVGGGGTIASEFEFSGGFGVVDQAFVGDHLGPNFISNFSNNNRSIADKIDFAYPSPVSNNLGAIAAAFDSSADLKPPIFNPQLLINQHPQNPSFFLPFSYAPQFHPHELQQHQQAIVEHLYKAAELLQTGNSVLAQGILARLNHHLSPIGKPFNRAAFYCKEALQLLLHTNNNTNPHPAANSSPFSLIFKIGAYKSLSEISPLIEFANFTCNQALLEVLEGFDRIHIVDFDIGYGGQWASLMQELALRSGGAPLLKITALASPSTHDQLELSLTRENLIHFANEINIGLEFEVISIDSLNSGSLSLPFHVGENEAIAVNLPVCCLTNYQLPVPLVLRFVKQLSPRIVVSVDRGCDRTDLPFANHIIHALQSYSNLLESLDAVNVNIEALQKIERFLLQPGIEKNVMARFHAPGKSQHWRTLFLSCGFTPVTFSNFTESQAECVVKRTSVRGFQVEKRQSSLVLCWQRKELVTASVWRC